MRLTYRQVRRAHRALQEIGAIRDGGMKQTGDNVAYVGKLVLPRRARLRTRSMLRVLGEVDEELLELEREMAKEVEGEDQAALRKLQEDAIALLNMEVPQDVNVEPLRATDLGDDALDHIPDSLLVSMGPLFVEDGDEDGGAGDPRNREERRAD